MDDLARAKRGDRDALGRLISTHEHSVGRILWRFTRDQGEWESLVQDTFVEMIGSIRGFRADSDLERWLARIATRVGYRHWTRRRRSREQERPLPEAALRSLAARPGAARPHRASGAPGTHARLPRGTEPRRRGIPGRLVAGRHEDAPASRPAAAGEGSA
jgi:DNA-directed RNA polymerase specialized sigma24 family protein